MGENKLALWPLDLWATDEREKRLKTTVVGCSSRKHVPPPVGSRAKGNDVRSTGHTVCTVVWYYLRRIVFLHIIFAQMAPARDAGTISCNRRPVTVHPSPVHPEMHPSPFTATFCIDGRGERRLWFAAAAACLWRDGGASLARERAARGLIRASARPLSALAVCPVVTLLFNVTCIGGDTFATALVVGPAVNAFLPDLMYLSGVALHVDHYPSSSRKALFRS